MISHAKMPCVESNKEKQYPEETETQTTGNTYYDLFLNFLRPDLFTTYLSLTI